MQHIQFENAKHGIKAIIKAPWQESFLQTLLQHDIKELELNTGKGWKGSNLDFLEHLTKLEAFVIIDQTIKTINPIHKLHKLKSINISTYCRTPIDFSNFPNLTNCGFEWRDGSESLFDCETILLLGINNYNKKTSQDFSKLVNLQKLTILNAQIESLSGLSTLKKLNYLSISNLKNLASLYGIEFLTNLQHLEIQKCKNISNISDTFSLGNITYLSVIDSGNIDSIKGIDKLTNLEAFLFYESTNIVDGDLTPLTRLTKLSKVSFQNRKHYSHKREEFGKL